MQTSKRYEACFDIYNREYSLSWRFTSKIISYLQVFAGEFLLCFHGSRTQTKWLLFLRSFLLSVVKMTKCYVCLYKNSTHRLSGCCGLKNPPAACFFCSCFFVAPCGGAVAAGGGNNYVHSKAIEPYSSTKYDITFFCNFFC